MTLVVTSCSPSEHRGSLHGTRNRAGARSITIRRMCLGAAAVV
jgi:hypothetical protein